MYDVQMDSVCVPVLYFACNKKSNIFLVLVKIDIGM